MKKCFLLALVFMPIWLNAQNNGSVINTDRPGFSDASRTVPKGYFQIESGFSFQSESFNTSLTQQLINFNNTLLRYGIINGLELRVNQSIQSERILENDQLNELGWQKGLSPLMLGIKVNLTEENDLIPETAFVAEVTLPKSQGYFMKEKSLLRLNFIALHSLNDSWIFTYNLGIHQGFNERSTQFNYTLKSVYTINDFSPYLEFYGNRSISTTPLNYFNGGLAYLVNNKLQFDVHAGMDIVSFYNETLAYSQSFVSLGIGYMFQLVK
ncbi:transporter [Marivirga sp. S37H4]|uniref:Transporter n=1 Tax=Marivirga aurantiaca TaxID=2802615 RepID=A0A935C8U4_9BACT|nr:transporter [Marivirga aurantiaca]MBK6263893.1 transporter [Marivirga aurantiaca]